MWLFNSDQYDHKALIRYGFKVILMMAAFKVSGGLAAALAAFFAFGALIQRTPVGLMFWVLFLTVSSTGNLVIFGRTMISMLIVRVTLVLMTFLVAGKVFGSRSSRAMAPFWGILLYGIWECASSLQGYEPIVSYLKLLLFFCIFLAMYGVANEVNASSRVNARILRSAILAIVALMVLGSVALIPFPAIGQMRGEEAIEALKSGNAVSLFCGMCSHSQALGPMMGILGTFIFADLVFSIKKWDKFYVALLLSCLIVCVKTSSRTGMGTLIAGMGMVTFLFMQSRGVGTRWKNRVVSMMSLLAILGAVAIVAVPSMRERVTQFALKTKADKETRTEVTVENMFSSRQGAIDSAMRGFKNKPLIGNGFQVSYEMQFEHRSGLLAYLAAPIEKGVWIYAILEEGGLIGFSLFTGWLLVLFPLLYKRHAYVMLATFFAFMMANVGEFCLFAMTYVGGFYWTLTFAAGTLDVQRMKGQNIPVFFVPIKQVQREIGMDEWVRRKG